MNVDNVKGAQIYEDAQKLHVRRCSGSAHPLVRTDEVALQKLTKTLSEEFARKLSGEESHELPQPSSGPSVIRIPTTVYKQVKQGMKMIEAAKSLE